MTQETFRPAFTDPPGAILAGIPISNLQLYSPDVSYGLPYEQACAKHVRQTFKAHKAYLIASGTLSRESDKVSRLINAINADSDVQVVGVRKGMTPHTPWSEILQITAECRDSEVDCLITVGAGSITDGAKIVVLVGQLHLLGRGLTSIRRSQMTSAPQTSWQDIQSRAKNFQQT
jgi:alcohol dehydrogenase class IV